MPKPITPETLARLAAIVGPEHALTDPGSQLPYLREMRDLYHGKTPLVLRPASTAQVAQIMTIAHEAGLAVVPQAGNTGLVGGQVPFERGDEIVLSVARMNRIRDIDATGSTLIAEAGVTLAEVQAAADRIGKLFPLSLASEGSCRIGGNLGSNAGGVGVLAYGNARNLALGLEVVLADGRVWNGLRRLKKDNTGYDLRDLFIGSEGTLGIITAAVLKLFPKPAEKATAIVALPDVDAELALFTRMQDAAGGMLTAFEFLPRIAIEFVLRHAPGTRDPFADHHPWYALIELSSGKEDGSAARLIEDVLASAVEDGLVLDAAIAQSLSQAKDFWRLREEVSDAQRPEGGSIKHDVSVPVAKVPELVTRANALVAALCPQARPVPFGHLGDGNVHYNVSQPPGMVKAEFLALYPIINEAVHGLVLELEGSISAEHGIGRLRREELMRTKDPVELDLMRRIKTALDPQGLLNPGKLL